MNAHSLIRLLDATKLFLRGVIDNYSRKLLAWELATRLDPTTTCRVLEAAGQHLPDDVPTVACDSGVENVNGKVDTLVGVGPLGTGGCGTPVPPSGVGGTTSEPEATGGAAGGGTERGGAGGTGLDHRSEYLRATVVDAARSTLPVDVADQLVARFDELPRTTC